MVLASRSMRNLNSIYSENMRCWSKSAARRLCRHSGTLMSRCHVCAYSLTFYLLTTSNRPRHVRPATPHDRIPLSSIPYGMHHPPPHTVIPFPESKAQSETIRTAIETLQAAMKDYKSLMKDSTAGRIVRVGAALAEVFLPIFCSFHVLHPYRSIRTPEWPSALLV
jgi:hypothetical protein